MPRRRRVQRRRPLRALLRRPEPGGGLVTAHVHREPAQPRARVRETFLRLHPDQLHELAHLIAQELRSTVIELSTPPPGSWTLGRRRGLGAPGRPSTSTRWSWVGCGSGLARRAPWRFDLQAAKAAMACLCSGRSQAPQPSAGAVSQRPARRRSRHLPNWAAAWGPGPGLPTSEGCVMAGRPRAESQARTSGTGCCASSAATRGARAGVRLRARSAPRLLLASSA